MRTIGLVVAYDGTDFHGWQRQPRARTVQETLEQSLGMLLGQPVPVVGASRTDAGVHATGQVAHFRTSAPIPADKWPYVLNAVLPPDVRVMAAFCAPDAFHARFSATGKQYRYRLHVAPHASPLLRRQAHHVFLPLSVGRMAQAAEALCGTHDFSAFRDAGCQAGTTIRTVHEIRILGEPPAVDILVSGDAFLYHMIRILAGTLVAIGTGRLPRELPPQLLLSGDRASAGPTAPACGLVLEKVCYPPLATSCSQPLVTP
jgi:tRNA pseudouridine38-40 synthase